MDAQIKAPVADQFNCAAANGGDLSEGVHVVRLPSPQRRRPILFTATAPPLLGLRVPRHLRLFLYCDADCGAYHLFFFFASLLMRRCSLPPCGAPRPM